MRKGQWARFAALILFGVLCTLNRTALANEITSGICTGVKLAQIPSVHLSSGLEMPEDKIRITQKYNTSYAEKADINGKWYWGHDGLDMHQLGAPSGQNNVYAIMKGVVVVSEYRKGWGESVIVATRLNMYSEEIVTHHYHHLHHDKSANKTTRKFGPCEFVPMGAVLAKEGKTGGDYATHLHLGIRRWANLAQLKSALQTGGSALYGFGYSYGNDAKLAKNLDPQGFLFGTFKDLPDGNPNQVAYGWARDYALDMREEGIELGLFDGRFGAGEPVKRREAARWIKIAAKLESVKTSQATFPYDVTTSDPDSPYVEALTLYPAQEPVINPKGTCQKGSKKFCPDNKVNRAEALKMTILAFHGNGFLQYYKKYVWQTPLKQLISAWPDFKDVDPESWYAPYVYYGAMIGIVKKQTYFKPGDSVVRAEMAKWIMGGYQFKEEAKGPCGKINCWKDHYCDSNTGQCMPIAECVPSEAQPCEVGGGYDACAQNPVCQTGAKKQQTCNGDGIRESTCTEECEWGMWGDCKPKPECNDNQSKPCGQCGTSVCTNGKYGSCLNQGYCSPGDVVTQACNGNGFQSKVCNAYCGWGSFSTCGVNPVCNPGAQQQQSCNNGLGTATRTCGGDQQWGQWGACIPNPACTANQKETKSCNNGLGTETRVCNQSGQWGQWGACVLTPACTPGQKELQACNNGLGTKTRTCDQSGQWGQFGQCVLTPVCTPGQQDQQSCNNGQGTETRICDQSGQWGQFGQCVLTPVCTPGQQGQQSCNNGQGTQTRICDQSGQWGQWSTCVLNCACISGSCCDGCNYMSSNMACNQSSIYQCEGSSPGQNAQKATVTTYCSGQSSACTGQTTTGYWQTLDDCASNEICQITNGMPQCAASCTDTFTASKTSSCYGNPQGSGSPTLCLETKQSGGSTWQYRICKQSGTFQYNFDYSLVDENHLVTLSAATGLYGSACTPWKSYSLSYITKYGAQNGAGLRGQISSPAGCKQSGCQYTTGGITVQKICQ